VKGVKWSNTEMGDGATLLAHSRRVELSMYDVMRWNRSSGAGIPISGAASNGSTRAGCRGGARFVCVEPSELADGFVRDRGLEVPRKVNFVATVQLFCFRPLKWLLTRCGVIPINRVRDDPRAMRTVADTFEACFRVPGTRGGGRHLSRGRYL